MSLLRPGAPLQARIEIPATADILGVILEAGGDPQTARYYNGVLIVPGVAQHALDAAVASKGDPTYAARVMKTQAAKARMEALLAAGMPWKGGILQIDEASLARIAARSSDARAGTLPDDFFWVMKDNSRLPLDADGMQAMAEAAADYAFALRSHFWTLRDLVASAGSRQGIDAVDVNNGWPLPPVSGE